MSIRGIGNDIFITSRIRRFMISPKKLDRFARRILHPQHELPKFQSLLKTSSISQQLQFLASTWASKEALYKSLDPIDQKNCRFNEWYRTYEPRRMITSDLYQKSEQFLLTISHDGDYTSAFVVRIDK